MNEAKVYADGFQKLFPTQDEFLDFIKRITRSSVWERKKSKDLRLVAFEKDSRIEEELRKQYTDNGMDEGILEDTLAGTGLLLKAKGKYYPVRDCAVQSILKRASIGGSALQKVEKSVYARILNECLKVARGEALLRISEGKVSAVLGGDSRDYAVLDMEKIFMLTVEYLQEHFKGCSYLGGYYEHSSASALWELSGEDDLLRAYQKELDMAGMAMEDMKPVIRVSTSDTGNGGANIYPMLVHGKEKKSITLGSPLRLEHREEANIKDFEKQIQMVYGKYQLAIGKLTSLIGIEVANPVSCMVGVMKKTGIPKKLGMEAVELFRAQHGENACTAHEIYYGISEVLFMMESSGEEGSRTAAMEEKVARALSVDWREYDIPGEVKW